MIVHENCSINKKSIKIHVIINEKQCDVFLLLISRCFDLSPATICLLLLQFGVDGPCAWCAQATLGSPVTWLKVRFEVGKDFVTTRDQIPSQQQSFSTSHTLFVVWCCLQIACVSLLLLVASEDLCARSLRCIGVFEQGAHFRGFTCRDTWTDLGI